MFSSELTRLLKGNVESSGIDLVKRVAAVIDDYLLQSSETPAAALFAVLKPQAQRFAKGVGKQIHFETVGDATQVFVTTAYALVDTLIQLVHNAVIHGIEDPAERESKGKDPKGRIVVGCRERENRIVFEVTDDGRGISLERVKARYRSLFNRPPPESLLEIVAEAGFSTIEGEAVSAGRGIGIDGVRHTVERLFGGSFGLSSVEDKGTTVTLSIPSGKKLVSVVVARTRDTLFAVPAALVVDALPIQQRLITRDYDGNMYFRFDGQNVRLYRIEEGGASEEIASRRLFAILVRMGKIRSGILVDELISNELALLDESHRSHVYSQQAQSYVQFLVPLKLL